MRLTSLILACRRLGQKISNGFELQSKYSTNQLCSKTLPQQNKIQKYSRIHCIECQRASVCISQLWGVPSHFRHMWKWPWEGWTSFIQYMGLEHCCLETGSCTSLRDPVAIMRPSEVSVLISALLLTFSSSGGGEAKAHGKWVFKETALWGALAGVWMGELEFPGAPILLPGHLLPVRIFPQEVAWTTAIFNSACTWTGTDSVVFGPIPKEWPMTESHGSTRMFHERPLPAAFTFAISWNCKLTEWCFSFPDY